METNEAFPAREKNPADIAKLEGYNPKMAETSCAKVAGADRRAGKANEAWALYKWNPGVTFPMNYASIMAEVSPPRWKHLYIWIFSRKNSPGPPYFILPLKKFYPTNCLIAKYSQNVNLGKMRPF